MGAFGAIVINPFTDEQLNLLSTVPKQVCHFWFSLYILFRMQNYQPVRNSSSSLKCRSLVKGLTNVYCCCDISPAKRLLILHWFTNLVLFMLARYKIRLTLCCYRYVLRCYNDRIVRRPRFVICFSPLPAFDQWACLYILNLAFIFFIFFSCSEITKL